MLHLWQRQPDEPADDYTAFVAYLRLAGRRTLRGAARQSGLPYARVRTLAARHRWKIRQRAWQEHRAGLEQQALAQMLEDHALHWRRAVEDYRSQEWSVAINTLAASSVLLARAAGRRHPRPTLAGVCRLALLASRLGRLAVGMELPNAKPRLPAENLSPNTVNFEDALRRIYGDPKFDVH